MRLFRLFIAIALIAWVGQSYAQNALVPTFKASKKVNTDRLQANDLAQSFKQYTLLEIDHQAIFQFTRQQKDFTHFKLDLGDFKMDLPLEINPLRKADCSLVLGSNPDKKMDIDIPVYTYKGRGDLGLDRQIRMTIHEDYISAFLLIDGEEYYLEPANRFTVTNDDNDYVWYRSRDIIEFDFGVCGVTDNETHKSLGEVVNVRNTCIEADLAIAADYSYYIDHGNDYTQVITDLEEIFNIVDGIYQTDLDVDLQIITYFIVDCAGCDPWTTSTSPGAVLSDFRNWGNAGGFLTELYDVASFWTDRNIDSYVGYASVSAVCSSRKYNINQDYTSNLDRLKTLWAHELGHNFGSTHDDFLGCDYGDIMWPNVIASATNFSSCSIDVINAYIDGVSCMSACNACPGREHISTTLSGTTKIEVDHEILADNDVLSSADVIYDAGYEVVLLPGFHGQMGCDFLGVIDGCGGTYKTVNEPKLAVKPETVILISDLKCYPNPFSESTILSYTLDKDQAISLSIFNPNGQEVARLLENVNQIAGKHEMTFDGKDLPAGVYLYRFTDGEGNVLMGKVSKF